MNRLSPLSVLPLAACLHQPPEVSDGLSRGEIHEINKASDSLSVFMGGTHIERRDNVTCTSNEGQKNCVVTKPAPSQEALEAFHAESMRILDHRDNPSILENTDEVCRGMVAPSVRDGSWLAWRSSNDEFGVGMKSERFEGGYANLVCTGFTEDTPTCRVDVRTVQFSTSAHGQPIAISIEPESFPWAPARELRTATENICPDEK